EFSAESEAGASEPGQPESSGGGQTAEGARPWRGRRRRGGRRRGNEVAAESSRETQNSEPASTTERYAAPPSYQPMILPGESIAKFNRPSEPGEQTETASGNGEAQNPEPQPAEQGRRSEGERGWRSRDDRGGRFQQRGDRRRDDRRPRFEDSRRGEQWSPP